MTSSITITPDTVIKRNDVRFIANKLGEEMVMMNMDNGDFITLNNVGADVWDLTAEELKVADLIQKLTSIYNISAHQCTAETINFLQASVDQGMFIITALKASP